MAKALVLGGYGLIGAAVMRHLADAGFHVTGMGRSRAAARNLAHFDWIVRDITKLTTDDWAATLANFEVVVNASGALQDGAHDNLRAIQAQEDAGVALTPEFLLDLKLSAQQRLADAETQEVQALSDYMIAISESYRVMGTLLDQAGISVEVPVYTDE